MSRRRSGFKALLALSLMGGLLVAVGAPAEAAAARLSLSRTSAIAKETVTVTVKAGQRLKRPVRLEYRDGRTWRLWRKGVTNKDGVKRFSVSTARTSVAVRARFPKTKVKGKKRAARTTRAATLRTVRQTVALQVTKNTTARTVTAVATVTPARAGRKVSLQRREANGTWRTLVSGRGMDARGRATFASFASDFQSVGRQYRVHVWGRTGAPSMVSSAAQVSWPISVDVLPPQFADDGGPTLLNASTTGPVDSVRFYVDGQEVARDTAAPWQVTWQPVRGRHDLTARAIGPGGTVLSTVTEFDQAGTLSDPSTGLPAGFSLDTLQAGFTLPTAFAVAPSGRVFVAEKSGRVVSFMRTAEGSSAATHLVADLSDHVAQDGDQGMTGLAVDPRYGDGSGDHDRVYVSYVLKQEGVTGLRQAQQVQVLDLADWEEGDAALGHDADAVILGRVTDGPCLSEEGPFPDDCLPLVGASHTIGDLTFDHEGNLLVGVGDGASFAAGLAGRAQSLRALDPQVLAGKVLRIDPVTGRGVEANPYYGDARFDGGSEADHGTSNASRVLALGLRNPFRITEREDGLVMIGDVGETEWEELDVLPHDHAATEPTNFGWPCYEGTGRTQVPVSTEGAPDVDTNPWDHCRLLWERGPEAVAAPAYSYKHLGGASVTGGVFYTGDLYPQDYRNSYFFGDYAQDFVRTARVDTQGAVTDVESFAPAGVAGGPVKFLQGPDDRVWYLSIYDGSIRAIDYAAPSAVTNCPVGTFARTYHDLTDSSLANPESDYEPGWAWVRFVDAALPLVAVGSRECVPSVDLAVTSGKPHVDLPSERYGVRWQGRVRLEGGTYEFAASGKDWVRLWINEELQPQWFAYGGWGDVRTTVKLPAGIHTIRMELVHDSGDAFAGLDWDLASALPTIGLSAPANGVVLPTVTVAGDRHAKVEYRFDAAAGDESVPLESVTVTADLLHVTGHDQHAHPFRTQTYTYPADGASLTARAAGTFELDDGHARGNSVFRLRAKVMDASGASQVSAPVYVCLTGNAVGICGSS